MYGSLTFLPINIILLPFFTPNDFNGWENSVKDCPKTKKTHLKHCTKQYLRTLSLERGFFLQASLKLFKLSQRDKQKFLALNDINLNSVSLAFLKQHLNLLTKYINLSAASIGRA